MLVDYAHLLRARTDALERLARAIGVLPDRCPLREGSWRATLQLRIRARQEQLQQRDSDLAMKTWTLDHSPRPEPIQALRVTTLARYLDMGMTLVELKRAAPWALAHEITMAMGRKKR